MSGVRLLFQKIQHLEGRIADVLSQIEKFEVGSAINPGSGSVRTSEGNFVSILNQDLTRSEWLLISVAVTCASIVFSHWLLLFIFNSNTIFLRVLTILIPIIIGSIGAYFSRARFLSLVTSGLLVGVMSVAGMLGVTAWIDGVEWLPTSSRDQKEAVEYVLAIWLGFSTGYFVFRAINSIRAQQNLERQVIGNTRQLPNGDASQRQAIFERLEGLVTTLSAMGSAATALYSGLKTFFD